MYSEIVNGLGFSQNALELMVLSLIGIFILGAIVVLYWKYIVAGALALGCVVVMANHKSETPAPVKPPVVEKVEKKEEVINQVKPTEELMTQPKDAYNMFMEDCINLADYNKTYCDNLWKDRVEEERAILENTKHRVKI